MGSCRQTCRGARLRLILALAASTAAVGRPAAAAAPSSAGAASAPAKPPLRPCTADELRRRGWNLSGDGAPCARPAPRARPPRRPFSLFVLPYNGLALKLGGHVLLATADRGGVGVEPALSYFWRRQLEVGLGVQVTRFSAEDDPFYDDGYPDRSHRERSILPRLHVSLGDGDGFWRFHLRGAYGPTWLLSKQGSPSLPRNDRTVWSYSAGLGMSAGIFSLELLAFGYMSRLEKGYGASVDGPSEPIVRGDLGTAVSLGLVFPIALGSTSPPPDEPPPIDTSCRRVREAKAKPGMLSRCAE
jgi:hypothetical protein